MNRFGRFSPTPSLDGNTGRVAPTREFARVGISLGQIVALTGLGNILLGWLLIVATASPLGAVLALSVPVGVRIAIRVRVGRERRAFDEQLPDNLQVIASAMRAGHTFVGALGIVAENAPEPSRRELRRVLADEQLGIPLVDALNGVTARMNSRDFEHVALVAALQRETGGNTAEVIDSVHRAAGVIALGVGAMLLVAGLLIIRRIVDIKV